METWVLLLLIYRGATAVDGYTSYEDCMAAGAAAQKNEWVYYLYPAKRNAGTEATKFTCIPGPRR
jgi:hypothetical protein